MKSSYIPGPDRNHTFKFAPPIEPDIYEPNNDFDHATIFKIGEVPPIPSGKKIKFLKAKSGRGISAISYDEETNDSTLLEVLRNELGSGLLLKVFNDRSGS